MARGFVMPDGAPSAQDLFQQVLHLRIGQHRVGDVQAAGDLQFFSNGAGVVEQHEMRAILPGHVGEVVGAQLIGEEDRGGTLRNALLQLLPGERHALAGGGGEVEILGHPLYRQRHPLRAILRRRVLEPLLEGAAGEGGGDEHLGLVGGAAVGLSHIQRPAPPVEHIPQVVDHLGQQLEGTALEVADDPVQAPGGAFPQDLLTEGARFPAAGEAGIVHHHQTAPNGDGHAGAEQVRTAPHPVGHVAHRETEAPGRPAVRRRRGQDQVGFG